MHDELPYYVAFSVFPGIGPVRFRLLTGYFGTAKSAWNARVSDLVATGLGEKRTATFDAFRRSFNIPAYMATLKKLHIGVVPQFDSRYPALLSEIADAPFLLYVLGKSPDVPLKLDRTVAVVGTRRVTPYGREMTERIAKGLAEAGCVVVSGMAYGVDTVAHWGALAAGGRTVAVLGCGIDIIAPAVNARLYHAIADGGGAIVSEMPLGLRPVKGLFPARNRIISGLSLGICVTEGADDSGALITARYAAEQGRDVFAVPGPVTSTYSRGPFRLLKAGATLAESAGDILEALGLSAASDGAFCVRQADTDTERRVVERLQRGQAHIDEIVREVHLTTQEAAATLTVLEIKGIVKDYGNKIYGLL